jgi:hypothetical protein
MKTIVLTLSIAIALVSNSKGQAYQNFPNDSTSWVYSYSAYPNVCVIFKYETLGDTIIYGNKWLKLFYQTTGTSFFVSNSCSNPYSTNKLMGYILDDSIHKKVYYKDVASGYSDTLLYDFSVTRSVNDTFLQKTREGDTITYVVTQIDSVAKNTTNPNAYKYLKRYTLTKDSLGAANPQILLTEGVGYSNDIIPSNQGTFSCECGVGLVCFVSKKYFDDGCQGYLLLNTKDVAKDVILTLSPNPTTTTLNVYAPQATHLTIYNLLGEAVQSTLTTAPTTTITTTNLPNGIYLLKTNTGQVAKFIKE